MRVGGSPPAVQSWQAGVVARLRPPIAHRQEDRLLLFPKALPAGPNDCPRMDPTRPSAAERACGRLRAKEIVSGKACCEQPSPPPEGASNLQPVLHHAGIVSAQNWSTGERLCGGDANALAEEDEDIF